MHRSGRPAPRRSRLAAILLLLPALLVGACGDDDGDDDDGDEGRTDETTASDDGASTTTADGGTGDGGTEVAIAGYAFDPTPLTVPVGTTVTWTNSDDFEHTTTSDEDGLWDSEELATGAEFEQTFDEAGTYAYHCDIHNFMQAEVVVE